MLQHVEGSYTAMLQVASWCWILRALCIQYWNNHDWVVVFFKHFFIFTPKIGEDSQFDEHIFQMGWLETTNQMKFTSRLCQFQLGVRIFGRCRRWSKKFIPTKAWSISFSGLHSSQRSGCCAVDGASNKRTTISSHKWQLYHLLAPGVCWFCFLFLSFRFLSFRFFFFPFLVPFFLVYFFLFPLYSAFLCLFLRFSRFFLPCHLFSFTSSLFLDNFYPVSGHWAQGLHDMRELTARPGSSSAKSLSDDWQINAKRLSKRVLIRYSEFFPSHKDNISETFCPHWLFHHGFVMSMRQRIGNGSSCVPPTGHPPAPCSVIWRHLLWHLEDKLRLEGRRQDARPGNQPWSKPRNGSIQV